MSTWLNFAIASGVLSLIPIVYFARLSCTATAPATPRGDDGVCPETSVEHAEIRSKALLPACKAAGLFVTGFLISGWIGYIFKLLDGQLDRSVSGLIVAAAFFILQLVLKSGTTLHTVTSNATVVVFIAVVIEYRLDPSTIPFGSDTRLTGEFWSPWMTALALFYYVVCYPVRITHSNNRC